MGDSHRVQEAKKGERDQASMGFDKNQPCGSLGGESLQQLAETLADQGYRCATAGKTGGKNVWSPS